jgi:hypothetical protein
MAAKAPEKLTSDILRRRTGPVELVLPSDGVSTANSWQDMRPAWITAPPVAWRRRGEGSSVFEELMDSIHCSMSSLLVARKEY